MTKSVRKNTAVDKQAALPVPFLARKGETEGQTIARAILSPAVSSASTAYEWTPSGWREGFELADAVTTMRDASERVNYGDLSEIEASLTNQAVALNAMFTTLAQRARLNMLEYHDAFERYMKLALKTQNQARMTLETLANIKNPPVVYAKQANVTTGPQQVNNTLHAPATENKTAPSKLEATNEQPVDLGTTGSAGQSNSSLEAMASLDRA